MVRELHLTLIDQGIDSRLISLSPSTDELPKSKVISKGSVYSLSTLLNLKNYITKEVKAGDLIHSHLFPSNLLVALIVKIYGLRVCLITTEHSTSNRRRGKWWGKCIDTYLYSGYHKIIAISVGTINELGKWLPRIKPERGIKDSCSIIKIL